MNCWRASLYWILRVLIPGVAEPEDKEKRWEIFPLVWVRGEIRKEGEAVLGSPDRTPNASHLLWDHAELQARQTPRKPTGSCKQQAYSIAGKQEFIFTGPHLHVLYAFPYQIPHHDMNYFLKSEKKIIFSSLCFASYYSLHDYSSKWETTTKDTLKGWGNDH